MSSTAKDWTVEGMLEEFGKFRQELRQILYEHGVRSNPCWTEQDILDAFRKLLKERNR